MAGKKKERENRRRRKKKGEGKERERELMSCQANLMRKKCKKENHRQKELP